MQQLEAFYHAIARRLIEQCRGKFRVAPYDAQDQTKRGLGSFHILVQFPGRLRFSASSGGLGGRYIKDGTVRLYVRVMDGTDYLKQLRFLEQISNALHCWSPGLGLSPVNVGEWELDDQGPGGDFRVHLIEAQFSGYARGSNLSELGTPIDRDELQVYVSAELAEEEA